MILVAVVAASALSTPAAATRVLYSYVDKLGKSASIILNNFVSPSSIRTYPTLNCLIGTTLCNQAILDNFISPFTVAPLNPNTTTSIGARFAAAAANTVGLYDGAYVSSGVEGRLSVSILQDSDVVYSFVDTTGRSVTVVSNGYITDQIGPVNTTTCIIGQTYCSYALVDDIINPFTIGPYDATLTGFPRTFAPEAAYTPGVYTVSFGNGQTARLAVAGPVAAAVPEPGTWAMMIGGFGLAGGAMRRRATKARFA